MDLRPPDPTMEQDAKQICRHSGSGDREREKNTGMAVVNNGHIYAGSCKWVPERTGGRPVEEVHQESESTRMCGGPQDGKAAEGEGGREDLAPCRNTRGSAHSIANKTGVLAGTEDIRPNAVRHHQFLKDEVTSSEKRRAISDPADQAMGVALQEGKDGCCHRSIHLSHQEALSNGQGCETANQRSEKSSSLFPVYGPCHAHEQRERKSALPIQTGQNQSELPYHKAPKSREHGTSDQIHKAGGSDTLDPKHWPGRGGCPGALHETHNKESNGNVPRFQQVQRHPSSAAHSELRRHLNNTLNPIRPSSGTREKHASEEERHRYPIHAKQVGKASLMVRWRLLLWIDRIVNTTKFADKWWLFIKRQGYIKDQASHACRSYNPTQCAELTKADIDTLQASGLLRRSTDHSERWHLRSFSVTELAKERRRWITHAPSTNTPPVSIKNGTHFQLAGVTSTRRSASLDWAAAIDFKAYFHQFQLDEEFEIFDIVDESGNRWTLTTIPTGSNWAPCIAQIYTCAFVECVKRSLVVCHDIQFDIFIDNVRVSSNSRERIAEAVHLLYYWAAKFYIDINEEREEVLASMASRCPYTFLGIEYAHQFHSIRLSEKTLQKVRSLDISTEGISTLRQYMGTYGLLAFCSLVHRQCRAQYYFATKFLRRSAAKLARQTLGAPADYDMPVTPWNIALNEMRKWKENVLVTNWQIIKTTPATRERVVIYTDASDTGYGAVLFAQTGEVAIIADKFPPEHTCENINVKETIAVYHALTKFDTACTAITLKIDNTSALGALKRTASPSFALNFWVGEVLHLQAWERVLHASYVASSANKADVPSRAPLVGFWSSHSPLLWPAFLRAASH